MTKTLRRIAAASLSASVAVLSPGLPAYQAFAQTVPQPVPAGMNAPVVSVAGASPVQGQPGVLAPARLLSGEGLPSLALPVQRQAAAVAPAAAVRSQAPSIGKMSRVLPALPGAAAPAPVAGARAVAAQTRISRMSADVAQTLKEIGELSQASDEAAGGVGERIQALIAGAGGKGSAETSSEAAVGGGESSRLPALSARRFAEDSTASHGDVEVFPPALAAPGSAARSSWLGRLLHTPRRIAQAYGAFVDFWSGLGQGTLRGEQAREALRELALREYGDAVRFQDADPTFLEMREFMDYQTEGLNLSAVVKLLEARTELRRTAEVAVFLNTRLNPGAARTSEEHEMPGTTFVYSVGIYQRPGATPTSPALVAFDFVFPAYLGLGEEVKKTRLAGVMASDTLYFVPDLSALGELGRLAGDSDRVLGKSEVDRSLAAMVSQLDAVNAKNPSFTDNVGGAGDIGTSYSFKIDDPASGLTLGPVEERELYRRLSFARDPERRAKDALRAEAAAFGSYIVRRFLGEALPKRPVVPGWLGARQMLALGLLGLGAVLAAQSAAVLGSLALAAWKAVAAAAGPGTRFSALFGAFAGAGFLRALLGDKFGRSGVVIGAAFFASLFGGVALLLGGELLVGGMVLAPTLLFGRWALDLDPERPKPERPFEEGFNGFAGKDFEARLKAARRAFLKAGFADEDGRYAARVEEYGYGQAGMRGRDIADFRALLTRSSTRMPEVLVLLVREIPGRPGQPGVAVIRTEEQLSRMRADETGIVLPGGESVPYKDVLAGAGYSWE